MTKYLAIFLLLVAASSACAQLKEDDDWFIKKKKQASITTSGGTSVTVEMGGTANNYQETNNGNAKVAEASFFLTPTPSSGSITVNSIGEFVNSPDGAATTGGAIYNVNVSSLTQVVPCTGTNTPVTGCATGDAEYVGTIVGGSAGYPVGQNIQFAGFTNSANNGSLQVVAFNSGYLIMGNSSAVAETHAGTAYGVGSLLCGGTFASTPTNNVFSTIAQSRLTQGTGCATLSSNTWYAVVQVTTSATQVQGTSGAGTTCPNLAGVPLFSVFDASAVTSPTAFPTNINFNIGPGTGDGCYTAYVSLTYTTIAPFTIIQAGSVWATTNGQSYNVTVAPIQSGSTLLCATVASTNANPALTCNTTTSGTATDTLTKRGACSADSTGYQNCFWTKDNATANANNFALTMTNGGGGVHNNSMFVEVQGTASGGSYDTSAYDTTDITTFSFTSANSITTTTANEILFGSAIGRDDCTGHLCTWTGSSGWTAILNDQNQAAGGQFNSGLFMRTVSSTGTYSMSGTQNKNGATFTPAAILPALIGLHQ